jgi:hypothetical protein
LSETKTIMESLGGIGFSNTSSATKKKRSTTLRRPWNDRQLQDSSSLPSTPVADNNENKIEEREAVESDEGSTNGSFQGSNQVRQGGGHSTASTEGFLVPSKKKLLRSRHCRRSLSLTLKYVERSDT